MKVSCFLLYLWSIERRRFEKDNSSVMDYSSHFIDDVSRMTLPNIYLFYLNITYSEAALWRKVQIFSTWTAIVSICHAE